MAQETAAAEAASSSVSADVSTARGTESLGDPQMALLSQQGAEHPVQPGTEGLPLQSAQSSRTEQGTAPENRMRPAEGVTIDAGVRKLLNCH